MRCFKNGTMTKENLIDKYKQRLQSENWTIRELEAKSDQAERQAFKGKNENKKKAQYRAKHKSLTNDLTIAKAKVQFLTSIISDLGILNV